MALFPGRTPRRPVKKRSDIPPQRLADFSQVYAFIPIALRNFQKAFPHYWVLPRTIVYRLSCDAATDQPVPPCWGNAKQFRPGGSFCSDTGAAKNHPQQGTPPQHAKLPHTLFSKAPCIKGRYQGRQRLSTGPGLLKAARITQLLSPVPSLWTQRRLPPAVHGPPKASA